MAKINPDIRKQIYDRDGNRCLQCGSTDNLTIDHIVPLSRGGGNYPQNYQTMCEPCNFKKGSKIRDLRGMHELLKIKLPTVKKVKPPTIGWNTVDFHEQ